jgi:hypothetical protein
MGTVVFGAGLEDDTVGLDSGKWECLEEVRKN